MSNFILGAMLAVFVCALWWQQRQR